MSGHTVCASNHITKPRYDIHYLNITTPSGQSAPSPDVKERPLESDYDVIPACRWIPLAVAHRFIR